MGFWGINEIEIDEESDNGHEDGSDGGHEVGREIDCGEEMSGK